MDILLNMKLYALLFAIFATTLLSGCQIAPEAQPLILTSEDMALKRKPYDPCPGQAVPVDCCK
jgi:hypothetical protein